MAHKIQTIHHNGLAFFKHSSHANHYSNGWERPSSEQIVYEGDIDEIPQEVAKSIAEIHPNFEKYYAEAMGILYKTYTFKGGTESPVLALKTRRSKVQRDEDHKYVVIWKIFED
jgi:hypothetical protein